MLAAVPEATPLPPPDFDPVAAFPQFAPVRAAVAARDWPAIEAFFAQLANADDRSFACRIAAEVAGSEDFFERVAADPASPILARTMFAARLIEVGWAIRTGYRAEHVTRVQFDAFHGYLRRAEQLIIDSSAREPDIANAWDLRLLTARGLGLGQAEARRRYDRVIRHQPHFLSVQLQLVQQLCPKWSGSWEEMHAFARECMLAAPEGTLNGMLVVEGHIEHSLELGGDELGGTYVREPRVRQEVTEAATRSVLHPACQRGPSWYRAHGMFALYQNLAGNYPAAAVHFRALGNLASQYPWAYLGDPAVEFQRHRARALAKG
jgi:hypothetical protein